MYQSPKLYNNDRYYNNTNVACDFIDVNLNTNAARNLEQCWQERQVCGDGYRAASASEWNCNHSSMVYERNPIRISCESEKFKRLTDKNFTFNSSKSKSKADVVEDRVKRPMNGFMVFSKTRRRQLASLNPSMHNAEISKILGTEWKTMKQSEKQIYMLQALTLQKQHSIKHPDYKYQPKRRKNAANSLTKTFIGAKIDEQKQKCAQKRTFSDEKLNLGITNGPKISLKKVELSMNVGDQLTVNSVQKDTNEWYTCLRDIYDVDKEEFSQYFPK